MGAGASSHVEAFNNASVADITTALTAMSAEEIARVKKAAELGILASAFSTASATEIQAALAAMSAEELARVKLAVAGISEAPEKSDVLGDRLGGLAKALDQASIAEITSALATLSAQELARLKEAAASAIASAEVEGFESTLAGPQAVMDGAEMRLKFQAAFRAIDLNKSGFIEFNELEAVLQTLGVNMTSQQVAQVFRAADLNGDDRLDIDEYEALVRKAMPE